MNTFLKKTGFFAVLFALTIFAGNALAFEDTYKEALERGWSYDDAIQERLDETNG